MELVCTESSARVTELASSLHVVKTWKYKNGDKYMLRIFVKHTSQQTKVGCLNQEV
jgi:hypothetical protein